MTAFMVHGATTAPGSTFNEDAYGLWPNAQAPLAAWVLDGVTGINDHALLPGPSDAAWFVKQTQEVLPTLLVDLLQRPVKELVGRLADELSARQIAAWLSPDGADGHESPAASFTLFRQLGTEVEISRLGDCPVLLERTDGSMARLDNPALSGIEADISAAIQERHRLGMTEPAAIAREMMPLLRDIRRRRNAACGYGVLTADRTCLEWLEVNRFSTTNLRRILMMSDGFYRLVNVFGVMTDSNLLDRSATDGIAMLLAELRAIEAMDLEGARYPRLKIADDATALMLQRAI